MSWKKFDVTLADGESQPIHQPGEWVAFRESTGELLVSLPTGDVAGHMGEGERVRMNRFNAIVLRNETGSSVTAEVIVSDEEFIPSPTLTLSSSTPSEAIWDSSVAGVKPLVTSTGNLYTRIAEFTSLRDVPGGGISGSTSTPSPGGAFNRFFKRSNYHALHNENAAFHGVTSNNVRPWAFDATLSPTSGQYSYLLFSNNSASDVVLMLDEVWINSPGAYLILGAIAGSGSNHATAFAAGGKFTNDELGSGAGSKTLSETYASGGTLVTEVSSYLRAKILEQGINKLSRPFFIGQGGSIRIQSSSQNDMSRVHISGWCVDAFAFDTPPDVETI